MPVPGSDGMDGPEATEVDPYAGMQPASVATEPETVVRTQDHAKEAWAQAGGRHGPWEAGSYIPPARPAAKVTLPVQGKERSRRGRRTP